MSLVNDALKRAKQMQQSMRKRSHPELPLRPAATVVTQPGSPTWVWASFFGLLLGACCYLVWQSMPNNSRSAGAASSNEVLVAHAATPPRVAAKLSTSNTNAAEIATQPASLKLQSIFYIPGRSSVMINGQSLSVGSHIREFRIVEIKPDSVRLASATETKILKLH